MLRFRWRAKCRSCAEFTSDKLCNELPAADVAGAGLQPNQLEADKGIAAPTAPGQRRMQRNWPKLPLLSWDRQAGVKSVAEPGGPVDPALQPAQLLIVAFAASQEPGVVKVEKERHGKVMIIESRE